MTTTLNFFDILLMCVFRYILLYTSEFSNIIWFSLWRGNICTLNYAIAGMENTKCVKFTLQYTSINQKQQLKLGKIYMYRKSWYTFLLLCLLFLPITLIRIYTAWGYNHIISHKLYNLADVTPMMCWLPFVVIVCQFGLSMGRVGTCFATFD